MPFSNNEFFGILDNPLLESPYFEGSKNEPTPTPGDAFIITDSVEKIIADNGDYLIT